VRLKERVHNLLYASTELFDSMRRKCLGAYCAKPGVIGRVHEQMLEHHDVSNAIQTREPHRLQSLRRRGALGRKRLQNHHNVRVAGNNPGMEKRIPVHRILTPKKSIERIGISQDRGIIQAIKAEAPLIDNRLMYRRHF
jgi:hypothetical protein